jgi:hypothetical protein
MNIRLTNRRTTVPSFDGQSLPRAKEIDSPPYACDHYWIMTKELRAELTNNGLLLT